MKAYITFYIIVFFSLIHTIIIGQPTPIPPSFDFERFELPGNTASQHIQSIVQDSFGLMWFGSQNGLHRWDGYEFKTYRHDPNDSNSIASNYIEFIFVAKDSTLWLSAGGAGLNRFDYDTETFEHFLPRQGDSTSLSSDFINAIVEDTAGYIWLGTAAGLNRLDRATGKFKRFMYDPNQSNSLSLNASRSLWIDSENTLWAGTGLFWENDKKGGLNQYRPNTEDFVHYFHEPNIQNSLSSNDVEAIFEDSKGNFWVGTKGDGLHLMNRKTGEFQRLQNPSSLSVPFSNNLGFLHTQFVFEDKDNNLWIGAFGAGLLYYQPETGFTKHFHHQENDPKSLKENAVWSMAQSRDGTLWLSTGGDFATVYKIRVENALFDHFELPSKEDAVLCFAKAEPQKLWLGTTKSGLLKFDLEKERLQSIDWKQKNTFLSKQSGDLANIIKIQTNSKGDIYLLTDQPKDLVSISPHTGHIESFREKIKHKNSIDPKLISDILIDKSDRLWVLIPTKGELCLYEADKDKFIKYRYTEGFEPFVDKNHNAILMNDNEGMIWITGYKKDGTFLAKFDPITQEMKPNGDFDRLFTVWGFDNKDLSNLSGRKLHQLKQDKKGHLWLCSQAKIKEIDPFLENRTLHLNAEPTSDIPHFLGFEFDEQENLWLLTDQLLHFNPKTGNVNSYDIGANFKTLTAHRQTMFKDDNQDIYFGVQGGIHRLKINQIKKLLAESTSPKVLITRFESPTSVANTKSKITLPQHILTTSNIHLEHYQNAFDIYFTALDFHQPSQNRYQFKLEGYDEQWRTAGIEHKASYVKVPPGNYTLLVRAAIETQIWGVTTSSQILIARPWWQTWWAYTLYGMIVLSTFYALYRFQLSRQLTNQENHRLQEINQLKTSLYTNITHEFRTPLTVILGMTENLQTESNKQVWKNANQPLKMIARNGQNLLQLVNEMLDLAKVESGNLELNVQQADIIPFIKYLGESFHSLAEEKHIHLTIHVKQQALIMDFDATKLASIVSNLLSNAIKFTPEEGVVSVYLDTTFIAEKEYFLIQIKDNGKGISAEEMPHIFDRFYQADTSSARRYEGTGIGLALTKELVELMSGTIQVKSNLGKGSEFVVQLPVYRNVLLEEHTISVVPSTLAIATSVQHFSEASFTEASDLPLVLIIEDNKDVAHYIGTCLQGKYQYLYATNGKIGIEIALEKIPDLIISDVMMPEKNGFEVCATLKTDERTNHIPIILLTAKVTVQDRLTGLEQGADAYLAKPFEKEELWIRLHHLLELRKTLQQKYSEPLSVEAHEERSVQAEDPFIAKARAIVLAELENEDFSLHELAQQLFLSHSQVYRKLKAITGMSTSIFIRTIRLQEAKKLLIATDLTVAEIAYRVGFKTPLYFSQIFKDNFKKSPSDFRK